MSKIKDGRERIRMAFILFLVIGITILFIFMIRYFLIAILLAGIFCGLLFPVYKRLLLMPVLKHHPAITSGLLIVVLLVTIGLPLAGFLSLVSTEAIHISDNVVPWIQKNLLPQLNLSERFPDWLPFANELDPYKQAILGKLGQATSAIGKFLVINGSALTHGTITFFINLFVMSYAMFFFFLHGPQWIHNLAEYLPLTADDRQQVIDRGLAVTGASLKGILVIGVLQGFLIGLAFWAAGLEGAAFWGTIVVILSAIPGIGPPIIWGPAAMYLFLTDQTGWGIGLILWGILLVGTVDNVLRPRIVSTAVKIPDLLILLGTLGGILMFGAIGIIIGPVVVASLVTILEIYRLAFVRQLPEHMDF